MKFFLLFLILIYQKTLSFDHGPLKIFYPYGFCRFFPSCSQYCFQAIDQFGVLKGGKMGIIRLLHCHPWSRGGIDEVPK